MFTLAVRLFLHLIKPMLGRSHAGIVKVEAVAWSGILTRFHRLQVGICKPMEHRVGEWLDKRVAAMSAVREVVGDIKSLSHAELILTVVLDLCVPIEALSLGLHKLHVKFIQIT